MSPVALARTAVVAPRYYRCPDDPAIGLVSDDDLTACNTCDETGEDPWTGGPCRMCRGLGRVIGYRPNGFGAIGCRVLRAVRVSCPDVRATGRDGHATPARSVS